MKKLPWASVAVLFSLLFTGCTATDSDLKNRYDLLEREHTRFKTDADLRLNQLKQDNEGLSKENQTLKLENDQLKEQTAILQKDPGGSVDTLLAYVNAIDERLSKFGEQGDITVTKLENGQGYKVTITGDVLFESGKAEVRTEGKKLLNELAKELKNASGVIRIDGHTDNVRVSKPDTLKMFPLGNWQLAGARALNVLLHLKEQGVGEDKMFYTSFGQFKPRESNATEEGKRKNRRVEILVINGDFK